MTDFSADLDQIGKDYPALQPILKNTVVKQSAPYGPEDNRQLEFYRPWDSDNPNPGKPTVELFKDYKSAQDRRDDITGDLLHYLGAVNPATKKPVDQKFYDLKQQLGAARSPDNLAADTEAYKGEAANPSYQTWPFAQWDQESRLDAYVRAGLFPNRNPEWQQQPGEDSPFLPPEMQPVFDKMRSYLKGGIGPDLTAQPQQ